MNLSARFRICTPGVVHEIIDGDAVVIDLERGYYYSLERTAAEVWDGLDGGASAGDIAAGLADRYTGDPGSISAATAIFLGELEAEGLIAPLAHAEGTPAARIPGLTGDLRPPFEAPRLCKFTDLQDLLLLDPIDEVDASGWPREKR